MPFQKLQYPYVKASKYSYYKFIITECIDSLIKELRWKGGMSYNIWNLDFVCYMKS
jgi:hypothetical protein